MLQDRQALDQCPTAAVNEEFWPDRRVCRGVPKPPKYLSPTLDSICVSSSQFDSEFPVRIGHCRAVLLFRERVHADHEPLQIGQLQFPAFVRIPDPVPLDHRFDGWCMSLRQPLSLTMTVNNVHIPVRISAAQVNASVVREAVVHSREPFAPETFVKIIDDMSFLAESDEVLPKREVPIAFEPGRSLPPSKVREHIAVFRVVEGVVFDPGGNEARFVLDLLFRRVDEGFFIPLMPHSTRVGRGVNPRAPIRLAAAQAGPNVLKFPPGQSCGLFNPDDVVLEAQVRIDVVFVLEVAGHKPRAVGEGQNAAVRDERVG